MSLELHALASNRINSLPASDRGRVFSWLSDFAQNQRGWGNRLHRWEGSPGLWTARIDDNHRAVLIQHGSDWCVVFVGKHSDADRWATGRKVTVADDEIIMVFTPEGVEEIKAPPASGPAADEQPILTQVVVSDAVLAAWDVTPQAIAILRRITDVNTLLEFAITLPEPVANRVLGVACGDQSGVDAIETSRPQPDDEQAYAGVNLDVRRTFYIVDGNDDLLRVINEPMASWIAFLHPSQTRLADGRFKGPVKVSGSAGTGKTVVALHRARHLARQGKHVLLTTYADTLCANLVEQLALLCTPEERELIEVLTVHDIALRLLKSTGNAPRPDREGQTEKWLKELADYGDYARSPEWYVMEWEHVVHAHDIRGLDEYLAVARSGRGSRLPERERRVVWGVFEQLFNKLDEAGITDWATICRMAREALEDGSVDWPCDAVVVDEMQDLRPQELRFLSVLGGQEEDALMVVGDVSQRIFAPRFTMKSAGLDVVGRSFCLHINYRTTRQIKDLADDVVGGGSGHKRPDGAVSVYQGPRPNLRPFSNPEDEVAYVSGAIARLLRSGSYEARDVAVFARSAKAIKPVVESLDEQGILTHRLSDQTPPDGYVRVGSMHRAKGLEFKAVFVIGVSSEAVPDPSMVDHLFEADAREEAMERERALLYVAMTRARDELTVTWTGEPSAFLPNTDGDAAASGPPQ